MGWVALGSARVAGPWLDLCAGACCLRPFLPSAVCVPLPTVAFHSQRFDSVSYTHLTLPTILLV
eukprot:6407045-Amphidinium_carterae.1